MANRRSIRLEYYDYRNSGLYFVTICVHPRRWRANVFGHIENGALQGNRYGEIVETAWLDLPNHHPTATLHAFVLMPNHVHGVLILQNDVQEQWRPGQFAKPQADALGTIIGSFKSAVTRAIGEMRGVKTTVWQRSYYEHIVRNDKSLTAICRYIAENPLHWERDELNYDSGHGRPCPYENRQWRPEIPNA